MEAKVMGGNSDSSSSSAIGATVIEWPGSCS